VGLAGAGFGAGGAGAVDSSLLIKMKSPRNN